MNVQVQKRKRKKREKNNARIYEKKNGKKRKTIHKR